MPASDYAAASGGALRLKGSSISKTKKKKKKPASAEPTASTATPENPSASPDPTAIIKPETTSKESSATPRRSISPGAAERELKAAGGRKKTEAEKRYEENRKKRLEERLRKEGVKTHKEKVEELNKYLSGLSEHHDMPKIGPG